jgi:hypothetical protein
MAIKLSQGVVNSLAMGQGWGEVIRNSVCIVYSGAQPSTPETGAAVGTELVRFTLSSGALTAETRATALVDFTSATGNCTALTIGGVSIIGGTVTYTTPTALAAAVAASINSTWSFPDYYAVVGGTIVGSITYGSDPKIIYIIAPKNSGTALNGLTVACTVAAGSVALNGGSSTTLGGTGATAGVAAVNALSMTYPPTAGVTSKSGTWTGTASATGTAGWFRIICDPNYDTGLATLSTTNDDARLIKRIDGSVGTSGADMLVTSAAITSTVSQTVTAFTLTVPSA